jgi:hypothetical protein
LVFHPPPLFRTLQHGTPQLYLEGSRGFG